MKRMRGWLIALAFASMVVGCILAYLEFVRHAHLPAPSIQSTNPFSISFASSLGNRSGFRGNCELYIWTDRLPPEIGLELPGFQLSDVTICRPQETFVGAKHNWLIRISGQYDKVPDELQVALAPGHEYSLTSCPTFPFLGRWGFEFDYEERSNVWWKLEVLGLKDKMKDVPKHQIRTESQEFSGFPVALPPGKEAYFIRPPLEGRPGILLTGTFGKPN